VKHVELHFHLLPEIDDGPGSIEASLELARAAVADGTDTIVATPHIHPDFITDTSELRDRVDSLNERLRRERIALAVLPGGELAHMMVARLSDDQLDAIAQGPPGRRWVLLEAPFAGLSPDFTGAADELRARGFAAVIAHPERARQSEATASALQHELTAGGMLQLNAWSLAGLNGEYVRIAALRLLRLSAQAVIASDAHGPMRPPAMQLGLAALASSGQPEPKRFADTRPRALIDRGLAPRQAAIAA
jgi:protein-tyrosine phosphatase